MKKPDTISVSALLLLGVLTITTPSISSSIKSSTENLSGTGKPRTAARQKQVTALRRAIIGQESNGKFSAVNPDSGALGYGQVMPFNVAPWTKAALGKVLSSSTFLNSPKYQIKVIDHKLNEYFENALIKAQGNEDIAVRRVAATWYSGRPWLYDNTARQFTKGREYPSIRNYTLSILKRYREELAKGG